MSQTKRGFLKASSILSIIEAAFCIIAGIAMLFIVPNFANESSIKEVLSDSGYRYVEQAYGSYYFEGLDEEGEYEIITSKEIKMISKLSNTFFVPTSIIILGVGTAKLVMSILILNKTSKDKYSLGCTITLLVLSAVTGSMLQVGFLIAAMCIPNKTNKESVIIQTE